MARKPGSTPQAMKARAAKTAAAVAPASALAQGDDTKKGLTLGQILSPKFFREVRAEARKITWTTRKETWITSVMVGIMVVLAAAFFWIVDFGLNQAMRLILSLANGS